MIQPIPIAPIRWPPPKVRHSIFSWIETAIGFVVAFLAGFVMAILWIALRLVYWAGCCVLGLCLILWVISAL